MFVAIFHESHGLAASQLQAEAMSPEGGEIRRHGVRERLAARVKYVIADEYQDVNSHGCS